MKNWLMVILFALGFLAMIPKVFAQEKFPVVSANGFACSKNEEDMVTCRGVFPGNPAPALEITGYNVVWIRGEYPGSRFTYFSDSGCLCRAEFGAEGKVEKQECTSRFGDKKSFKGGKSTFEWCQKN